MPLFARPRRRLVLGATVTCLLTLTPIGAVALASSRTPKARIAHPPGCSPGMLDVWLDTNGNGTAGSIFYKLHFTNLSGHACLVFGYPGVSAVDLSGHQMGAAAGRDTSRTPHLVRLNNGQTATSVLRIVNARNFSSAGCRRATAAGLRVYPPNGATAKFVPFPFAACTSSTPVFLTVQAVRR
jgi:Protein of unknown function (DUF4232)